MIAEETTDEDLGVGAVRGRTDPEPTVPAALWAGLEIPDQMAVVYFDSRRRRWMALFSSPAGTARRAIASDAWGEVAIAVPLIAELLPDVEGLLIRGEHAGGDREAFRVPIAVGRRLLTLRAPK